MACEPHDATKASGFCFLAGSLRFGEEGKERRVWNRGRREEEREEGKGKERREEREDKEGLGGMGWRGGEKRAEWGKSMESGEVKVESGE